MPETFIGDDFHKEKDTVFRDVFWQGQKGSNPRHAVLEDSILSLHGAVSKASGDISRDIFILFHRFFIVFFVHSTHLLLCGRMKLPSNKEVFL